MPTKRILVIPDQHAHPDLDNRRAEWLGKLIVDRKPDIVINLGDMADMPSLSSYDKGTKGFEGRRYKRDCEAAIDFQDRLWSPLANLNKRSGRNKKGQWKPKRIITLGNHDGGRISKAVQHSPELDGTLDVNRDLSLASYWDDVHDFKRIVVVEGYAISHFLPSGIMGRPIGGRNAAAKLISDSLQSAIVGHSHVEDFASRTGISGQKYQGIVAGCYVHPDMVEEWNSNTHQMWWRGVVELEDVSNGYAEKVSFISAKTIETEYKNRKV